MYIISTYKLLLVQQCFRILKCLKLYLHCSILQLDNKYVHYVQYRYLRYSIQI